MISAMMCEMICGEKQKYCQEFAEPDTHIGVDCNLILCSNRYRVCFIVIETFKENTMRNDLNGFEF